MRTRLSRRKPSLTTRGASADPPQTMRGRAWRGRERAGPEGSRGGRAEETGGTEAEQGDEQHEKDHSLPAGAEEIGTDAPPAPCDDGAEGRPHHAAQAPQPPRHAREEPELEPRRGV